MVVPNVPLYGKDSDRLARLSVAHKALLESGSFLADWPVTVATPAQFKERIDIYQAAYEAAINRDRRSIAARLAAEEEASVTWQKIVNYACATTQDNTPLLEQMGVYNRRSRSGATNAGAGLYPPDFTVVNLDQRGAVRATCSRDRRKYSYEVQVTDGDPRVDEGWYHKASFGDCTKMDMDGYQSGKEYSFRCRIIGRDNKMGPWSHVITIVVT